MNIYSIKADSTKVINHYTYIIHDKQTDMSYIGVRTCKCPINEDRYMSSSSHVDMKDGLKTRPDDFKRYTLGVFGTREEAVQFEIDLHKEFDVGGNPRFYNRARQTSIGFDTTGTESIFRVEPTPVIVKPTRVIKTKVVFEADETRVKKSNSALNRYKNKPMPESTKELIRRDVTGRLWVYNDVEDRLIYASEFDDYMGRGYVRGRAHCDTSNMRTNVGVAISEEQRINISNTNKKKRWYVDVTGRTQFIEPMDVVMIENRLNIKLKAGRKWK
jgi:hypothetical protein